METPVEEHLPEVDREAHGVGRAQAVLVADAAEGPAQVAAQQAEGRHGLTGAAGLLDHRPRLGVGTDDDPTLGQRTGFAPRRALRDRHAALRPDDGGGGDDASEETVGGVAGGLGGAGLRGDVAQLPEKVDELLDVAHEVAPGDLLVGDDVGQVVAGGPAEGQVGEAGIG